MVEKVEYEDLSSDMSDDELEATFSALMAKARSTKVEKPKFVPTQINAGAVTNAVDSQEAMNRSMTEWQQLLAPDCGVYMTKYGYLIKPYDSVVYEYIGHDDKTATDYAKHNLVAILRYKYFKILNDESQEQIDKIVSWFCKNIYNNVCYLTVNADDPIRNSLRLDTLPPSAVAFANGVFDFKENKFILKYERIRIPAIRNTMVLYKRYVIMWCFNYDFEPFDINIMETPFDKFTAMLRNQPADKTNLSWQLFSNMAHDRLQNTTHDRMEHLAQVLGYTIMTPMVQSFVILIGAGQNGKNSLYDGAFSHFVYPAPGQESLDDIENDRFIGGTLRGLSHNICLETVPGVKKTSDQLKKLTGSGEFAIEEKGKTKTTIPMNCKFVFSGNDQNNIKFSDRSHGFDRRCNLFELYYTWDREHSFMKLNKDYYACDFTLTDIMSSANNNKIFVYIGMYGIMSATNNFTSDFVFSHNDWNETYTDTDYELKEYFTNDFNAETMFRYWNDINIPLSDRAQEYLFYVEDRNAVTGYSKLSGSDMVQREYGKISWKELAGKLKQYIDVVDYDQDGNEMHAREMEGERFMENVDFYICIDYLRNIFKLAKPLSDKTAIKFNNDFRKAFNIKRTIPLYANKSYVRARLLNGKVKFLNEV